MLVEKLKEYNIALFGAGKYLQSYFNILNWAINIKIITDNDENKWGMYLGEKKCIPPNQLKENAIDYVIITVENDDVISRIKEQLNNIQIRNCTLKEILPECIEKWDNREIGRFDALPFQEEADNGKIKRYVECYMLKQACNLRCSYCFVGQSRELANKVIPLLHSPEFIAKALSKKRLGGTGLISICCDGEPLISNDMIRLIRLLLEEGHYVYLISNGTLTKQMEKIESFPVELLHRLFIRFSYHFAELKRLKLLDTFFDNINKFHRAGGSFTLFLVGSEEYLQCIDEIKQYSLKYLGALPHVDYERNEHAGDGGKLKIQTGYTYEEYKKIWEDFDSEFFIFREKLDRKISGLCYAGKWVIHLDLMTGNISRCPAGSYMGNIYEDICQDIPFDNIPRECPLEFCVCAPVFFAFGMRPDYKDAPSFYELWNRKNKNTNENWIHKEIEDFFKERLDISYGL